MIFINYGVGCKICIQNYSRIDVNTRFHSACINNILPSNNCHLDFDYYIAFQAVIRGSERYTAGCRYNYYSTSGDYD